MSHTKRKHLRGQGKLVRSQFPRSARISAKHDPARKFRRHMLALAKESLQKAAEWCDRDESATWALVMTDRAKKFLEAAREL